MNKCRYCQVRERVIGGYCSIKCRDKSHYYDRLARNKTRFGGFRELVLVRDGYACRECGMTNEEHKRRWNREITIDHKNNLGRYSKIVDNSPDNLITLCLICHGRKDVCMRKKNPVHKSVLAIK